MVSSGTVIRQLVNAITDINDLCHSSSDYQPAKHSKSLTKALAAIHRAVPEIPVFLQEAQTHINLIRNGPRGHFRENAARELKGVLEAVLEHVSDSPEDPVYVRAAELMQKASTDPRWFLYLPFDVISGGGYDDPNERALDEDACESCVLEG